MHGTIFVPEDASPTKVRAIRIAALLKTPQRFQKKAIVVILYGANLSLETLKTIL
jgi:threonine dehydratase